MTVPHGLGWAMAQASQDDPDYRAARRLAWSIDAEDSRSIASIGRDQAVACRAVGDSLAVLAQQITDLDAVLDDVTGMRTTGRTGRVPRLLRRLQRWLPWYARRSAIQALTSSPNDATALHTLTARIDGARAALQNADLARQNAWTAADSLATTLQLVLTKAVPVMAAALAGSDRAEAFSRGVLDMAAKAVAVRDTAAIPRDIDLMLTVVLSAALTRIEERARTLLNDGPALVTRARAAETIGRIR